MALRLEWRRTWENKPEDFSCSDKGNPVGRIYSMIMGGVHKEWHWFLNGSLPGDIHLSRQGITETKQEAAEALEAAYFAAVERLESGPGMG